MRKQHIFQNLRFQKCYANFLLSCLFCSLQFFHTKSRQLSKVYNLPHLFFCNLPFSVSAHEEAFVENCGFSYIPPPNEFPGVNNSIYNLDSNTAKASDVPWIARVLVDGDFQCSGAIVNSRGVITSASCLEDALGPNQGGFNGISRIRVIVGAAFDFRAGRYGESVFQVSRISVHGNYINDANKNINDIAYLHIAASIGATNSKKPLGSEYVDQDFVRPVCTTDKRREMGEPGHIAVLSFWTKDNNEKDDIVGSRNKVNCHQQGNSTDHDSTMTLPHKVWLHVVPQEACMEHFPVNRRLWPAEHYICAEVNQIAMKSGICCVSISYQ